ncbi:MAG TPA: ribbon-helix-helix protein, CopG family [Actinomycetes bacterium]|nr:ribbon-helix-helix protein, CopG family [Actinomycetes bacterium]
MKRSPGGRVVGGPEPKDERKRLQVRVDQETADALAEMARAERRSVNNLLEVLIERITREHERARALGRAGNPSGGAQEPGETARTRVAALPPLN